MISIWVAYVLDIIVGDPYWFPHPVKYIGKYITFVEGRVRRIARLPAALKAGGIFLTVSTVLLTYLLSSLLLFEAKQIHIYLFYVLNIGLMWTCLATKSLRVESMKVFRPPGRKPAPMPGLFSPILWAGIPGILIQVKSLKLR
jgi:adenosylcobinamide-phosphate synthase